MKRLFFFALLIVGFMACREGKKYDASGSFEATEVVVSAEVAGKILAFNAEEGQCLSLGETLGYIDSTQIYLQKRQLEARLRASQSRYLDIAEQVAATEQQIVTQQRERHRFERLLEEKAVGQKTLDDIDSAIDLLRKQLDTQRINLRQANEGISEEGKALLFQIEQLSDQLRKCIITSPIDGTVLTKYAEAGELAAQGRALFKVADMDNLFLRAYITADQLTQLKLGDTVRVFADFGEKDTREYAGNITWIADKAEFTPKTIQTRDERANLVYAVKVAVKNDGYLKAGMYGELRIKN